MSDKLQLAADKSADTLKIAANVSDYIVRKQIT